MKLKQIKGNSYYLDDYNAIGVIIKNGKAVLIDTGMDDSKAKKILKELKNNDLILKAVINTHSHADHCGGNHYLQKNTDAKFYASRVEASLITAPEIEPLYLYNAYPIESLNNKFIKAKPTVDVNIIEDNSLKIDEFEVKIMDLKGHSPNMIGIISEDDVLYLGDAVIDSETVDKHKILYIYNLQQTLKTLNILRDVQFDYYVLYHGGLKESLLNDIEYNIKNLDDLTEKILKLIEQPMTKEDILKTIATDFELELNSTLYFLNLGAVSAHLSYLVNSKKASFKLKENKLYYKKTR